MKDVNINKARALYYNLFASFFVQKTDNSNYYNILEVIKILAQEPLDNSSDLAFIELNKLLDSSSSNKLQLEYDEIFYSPQSKNIRTTASYYDEGVESGKKRAQMLDFIAKTKIRRDEKRYFEYEDNIGFIFALLAELIDLTTKGEEQYITLIHCIFEQVLNEFVDLFAAEVYEHKEAVIYKEVIVLLYSFMEFERLYLEVSKPAINTKEEKSNQTCENEPQISEEERKRRERNKALKAKGPKQPQDESCPIDMAYDVETEV